MAVSDIYVDDNYLERNTDWQESPTCELIGFLYRVFNNNYHRCTILIFL